MWFTTSKSRLLNLEKLRILARGYKNIDRLNKGIIVNINSILLLRVNCGTTKKPALDMGIRNVIFILDGGLKYDSSITAEVSHIRYHFMTLYKRDHFLH